MNRTTHAVQVGLRRGLTEFGNSLRSPQDIGFYMFTSLIFIGYLFINRNDQVEGTSLLLPTVALPSILGGLVVFGSYVGPMYSLAMEREDGTLLRAKAVPRGMTGYVSGQVLFQALGIVPSLLIILIPSALLFDGLMPQGAVGWPAVFGIAVLGMGTVMPIGMIVGSLVKSPQKVGTWGMLPILVLFGTSGIFYPIQELWGWVQALVQVFPMYWLGLGMRSAVLPDEAAVLEFGESWRTLETVGVLGAWAVLGLVLAPIVLRRMARRQSGSAVEEGKLKAMQMYQ